MEFSKLYSVSILLLILGLSSIAELNALPESSAVGDISASSGSAALIEAQDETVKATYYYANNANGVSTCGQDLTTVATQATYCEPHAGAKPLNTYGNNIVAMAHGVISQDPAKYCGKEVQIFNNGEQIFPVDGKYFFIWDACMACDDDNHLDFSVLSLYNIFGDDVCQKGSEEITWKIVDNQVKEYVVVN